MTWELSYQVITKVRSRCQSLRIHGRLEDDVAESTRQTNHHNLDVIPSSTLLVLVLHLPWWNEHYESHHDGITTVSMNVAMTHGKSVPKKYISAWTKYVLVHTYINEGGSPLTSYPFLHDQENSKI